MLRRFAAALGLLAVAAGIVGFIAVLPQIRTLPIGAAYAAKTICSGVFISERDVDDLIENDLPTALAPLRSVINVTVDRGGNTVEVAMPLASAKAVYRENCGCTLAVGGVTENDLRQQAVGEPFARPNVPLNKPWPAGRAVNLDELPAGVNEKKLAAAFNYAFEEPHPNRIRGTRAMVVIHNGHVVGERYAPGYHAHMPLTSWSMTKTVTATLVGILQGQGKLDIHAPAAVPAWQGASDPRKAITLDQLMRMSSGLAFQEEYGAAPSDVVRMLYEAPSTAALAAGLPLETEPDGKWYYSSGTTNIISQVVRDAIGGSMEDYLRFWRTELFDKLQMRTPVIEADPSGLLVGSSFMYCSPRDWARYGQFLLQDGVWNGERILPEGFVDYMRTPTPLAPMRQYGAQTWLNAGEPDRPAKRDLPGAPVDLFYLSGFEGQRVIVAPSHNAVIVRLGRIGSSPEPGVQPIDWNELVTRVLDALPEV